jgi:hypothetical protein
MYQTTQWRSEYYTGSYINSNDVYNMLQRFKYISDTTGRTCETRNIEQWVKLRTVLVLATLLYGCENCNIIKYDGKSKAAKKTLLRSNVGYTL